MESRFVDTRDIRMHYYHAGRGEPVILIHGYPETAYEWRHQVPALARHFEVFAPDTRGHGRSDKPTTGYSRADLAQDIVNFMNALGMTSARVVAHDWGGIIAVKMALDHGHRIERLALMDTICTGWPTPGNYFYWFQAPGLAEAFFPAHAAQFVERVIGGGGEMPAPPEGPFGAMAPAGCRWATEEALEHYTGALSDPATQAADMRYYRTLPFHRVTADTTAHGGERYERVTPQEMAERWQAGTAGGDYLDFGVEDRQKQFGGPVLWMYGSAMLTRPGWQVLPNGALAGDPAWDSFSRHFPDLRGVAAESGHFIAEEAPEWTNARLVEFLCA